MSSWESGHYHQCILLWSARWWSAGRSRPPSASPGPWSGAWGRSGRCGARRRWPCHSWAWRRTCNARTTWRGAGAARSGAAGPRGSGRARGGRGGGAGAASGAQSPRRCAMAGPRPQGSGLKRPQVSIVASPRPPPRNDRAALSERGAPTRLLLSAPLGPDWAPLGSGSARVRPRSVRARLGLGPARLCPAPLGSGSGSGLFGPAPPRSLQARSRSLQARSPLASGSVPLGSVRPRAAPMAAPATAPALSAAPRGFPADTADRKSVV